MENMIWELGKDHSVPFSHSHCLSLSKTFRLPEQCLDRIWCKWEKVYKDNAEAMHPSFPVVSTQEKATECSLKLDGHIFITIHTSKTYCLISPVKLWKSVILTADCWSFPQVTVYSLSTFWAPASLYTPLIYKTSLLLKFTMSLFSMHNSFHRLWWGRLEIGSLWGMVPINLTHLESSGTWVSDLGCRGLYWLCSWKWEEVLLLSGTTTRLRSELLKWKGSWATCMHWLHCFLMMASVNGYFNIPLHYLTPWTVS